MRQTTQISQINEVIPGTTDFNVNVTYNDETITVIAGNDFLQYLALNYWEWSFFSQGDTAAAWYSYLLAAFNLYMAEMSDSYDRIYAALMKSYDPAANYSRDEQQSHKNTRTLLHGKTATTTYTNYQSEISYASNVTSDVTTFDDTTLTPKDKTSKGGKDTTTLSGSVAVANTGTDTTTDTGLLADNERKVTGLQRSSAAANLTEEINMRLHNDFLDIVLQGFADRYLFLLA